MTLSSPRLCRATPLTSPPSRSDNQIGFPGVRPKTGRRAINPMGKRSYGLRYAAALVAILHASLIVHAIHPMFHSQSLRNQACATLQSHGAAAAALRFAPTCGQACCQQSSGAAAAASPSVRPVGADCQICKFLLHFQSRDAFSGNCEVPPDAAREACASMGSSVYVAAIHSPANARAPPAPISSVTVA